MYKSMNMKKIVLFVLAAVQISLAGAQSGGTPPYLQKSFAGDDIQSVYSETSGGNISVYGVPAAEARVEVYVFGNNGRDGDLSREEIKRRLEEQYELVVSAEGHKLTATAKGKRNTNWNRGLSISFKIYVPVSSSTNLRTSGGNIALKKLSGTQDFTTSGGNLDIDQITGRLTGRTSGGNVYISDSKDQIDLTTSGGNVEATHCEGNLRLATSGGNVTLRLLKGVIKASTSGGSVRGEAIDGELSAHTSGGNVKLQDLSCSLDASTSAGNIDVSFKEIGKYITLSNSGGNVYLHVPSGKGMDLRLHAEKVNVNSLNNFSGDTDEHHIDGKINGGGIPVRVDGSGGKIVLDLK